MAYNMHVIMQGYGFLPCYVYNAADLKLIQTCNSLSVSSLLTIHSYNRTWNNSSLDLMARLYRDSVYRKVNKTCYLYRSILPLSSSVSYKTSITDMHKPVKLYTRITGKHTG